MKEFEADELTVITQYPAPDPFLQYRYIEVNQQTQSPTSEPKVCQQLCFMNRKEDINGFDLDNDTLLNKKVQSITTFKMKLLVNQG